MLEHMQASFQGTGWSRHSCLVQGLYQQPSILSCMGKIQDPQRIWPMQIKKALNPFCPSGHRTDLLGLAHPAPSHLHFGQLLKGGSIEHAGKGGVMPGLELAVSWSGVFVFDLSNGNGSDFCPFPFDQRDVGSIGTDHQLLTDGGFWAVFGWLLAFSGLLGFLQSPCSLGLWAHGWLTHLHAQQPFKQLSRTCKWHPDG
jgi:hypothetical protein